MIIDARDQSVASDHETSIAIVGAGAAGITLALAFAEKSIRCLVLEAGKTIMLEKPKVLELADRYGIAIVGYEQSTKNDGAA